MLSVDVVETFTSLYWINLTWAFTVPPVTVKILSIEYGPVPLSTIWTASIAPVGETCTTLTVKPVAVGFVVFTVG